MERLDPDQIYDPNVGISTPKVKQVFRITKEHRYDEICRAMHRHKKSPLMAPTSARKCLTEVGQPPAAATLEPPVLEMEEDDVNADDDYMMESHEQEAGVGGKGIGKLAGGQ